MSDVKAPGEAKLTAKQQRFVEEYLVDFNGTRAAEKAGYSLKTAYHMGSANLKKPKVQRAIARRKHVLSQRAEFNLERWLQTNIVLASHDPRALIDPDTGGLKPAHQWDDASAAAISSLDVKETIQDGVTTGYVSKVRFWSKNNALEQIAKHYGAYEADNAQRRPAMFRFDHLDLDSLRAYVDEHRTAGRLIEGEGGGSKS